MMLPCLLLACALVSAEPPDRAAPQQAPKIVLIDDGAELEKALASPAPRRDAVVRLTAFSLPGETAAGARVLIVAEIDARRDSSALASIVYALYDEKGRDQAHALRRAELRRRPSGALAFLEVVAVPPGAYRLKIAVLHDERIGTGESAVTARVRTAGPVRLGDLVFGDTPGNDMAWSSAAGAVVRGDSLVASMAIAAEAVLPPDLAITVEVAKDSAAPPMLTAPARVLPGDGRTRVAQAVFDARLLPPGNYTGRAVVSVGGRESARVVALFSVDRTPVVGAARVGAERTCGRDRGRRAWIQARGRARPGRPGAVPRRPGIAGVRQRAAGDRTGERGPSVGRSQGHDVGRA